MTFSPTEMWASMGLMAKGVVFILLFMSVYSLGVLIERFLRFRAASKQSARYAEVLEPLLKGKSFTNIVSTAQAKEHERSHLAKVALAVVSEFISQEKNGGKFVWENVKNAAERSANAETLKMKRGLNTLATIGSTAPFVGLFGTVVGVINAFRGMAATGAGGLGAVSAGIAEALVTTAFGLFVAIPAVWFYNFLTNKIEAFGVEMTNSSSELVDSLSYHVLTSSDREGANAGS